MAIFPYAAMSIDVGRILPAYNVTFSPSMTIAGCQLHSVRAK